MWWCSHIERGRSLSSANHVFSNQKCVCAAMTRTNDGDNPCAVQSNFTSLFRAAQSHVSRPMLECVYGESISTIATFYWKLEIHFFGILINRLLVWSITNFCRATSFELRKFNSINAGTSASPQSSIPNTCWGYKFCIFAVPFLGPKNGPIFGAASYNSNKGGPIWRPQNWDPEIVDNLAKLSIFGPETYFL